MLTTVISACGGGGSGGSSPAQEPAHKAATIDAEGDSTMAGYEMIDGQFVRIANSVPVQVQAILREQFGPTVTVENNGVASSTTFSSLNGLAPNTVPFAQRIAADPAQVVLTNYALNDMGARTLEEYASDLAVWIGAVRAAGKTPVLEEPNPVCNENSALLDTFVNQMRLVAQQQGVTLIAQYDYIKLLPNWQAMMTDCVHPGDALYAIKAQREAAILAQLVASLN